MTYKKMNLNNLLLVAIFVNLTKALELTDEYKKFEKDILEGGFDNTEEPLKGDILEAKGFQMDLIEPFKRYIAKVDWILNSPKEYIQISNEKTRRLAISKDFLVWLLRKKFFEMKFFKKTKIDQEIFKEKGDNEGFSKMIDMDKVAQLHFVAFIKVDDNKLSTANTKKAVDFKKELQEQIINKIDLWSGNYGLKLDNVPGTVFERKGPHCNVKEMGDGIIKPTTEQNKTLIHILDEIVEVVNAISATYWYSTNDIKYEFVEERRRILV